MALFFSFLSVKKDDFEGWRCFVGGERGILQFFLCRRSSQKPVRCQTKVHSYKL